MRRFILAPARPELTTPVPRRSFIARMVALVGAGALLGRTSRASTSPKQGAGSNPFIGEVLAVGFNFAPVGWAMCDGQLLPIDQNTALFSLIGTTYGGDGVTTFALPNLNGRAANHKGQGPGLSNHTIGEQAGVEVVTLVTSQLPAHSHAMRADSALGTSDTPTGLYPAKNAAGAPSYGNDSSGLLGDAAIVSAGNNQAHDNMQPYLAMNFIIALEGIFPSQN